MRWAIVVVMIARTAAGEPAEPAERPYSITAAGGLRLTLLSGEYMIGSAAVVLARRWEDRWHVGLRSQFEMGPTLRLYEQTGELWIWLHPSRRIDLLLAWRIGYAYFDFDFARIHALVIAPVIE